MYHFIFVFETDFKGLTSVRGYRMKNSFMEVTVISYGCAIQSMLVRDRTGILDDVITGYDNLNGKSEWDFLVT